jgi:hypothetical protein
MLKNKIILIVGAILLAVIVVQYFIFKNQQSFLEQQNLDLQEERKTEIKMVRDSAFVKIKELTISSQEKFDSILEINQEIKYIPYEKLIYFDRSLDDALDILSGYKYNTNPTGTN